MNPTPAVLYESVARTLPALANQPSKRFPLPQDSPQNLAAYAFDQEFEMLAANFPPVPINTPSSQIAGLTDANAILTKYSPIKPTMGGKGKATASFCIVPASWDDFKTQTVTFPSWVNTPSSGLARPTFSEIVNVRLHYDYFVVDPNNILAGAGVRDSSGAAINLVSSKGKIPNLLWPRWLNMLVISSILTPEQNSKTNDLVPIGNVTVGTNTYEQTFPALDQYRTWCANATTFIASGAAWTPSAPPVFTPSFSAAPWGITGNEGQYQFADSALKTYEGNIEERCTMYVMPK